MLNNKFVAFYTEDGITYKALKVIVNGKRVKKDIQTIEPTAFFGLNNFIAMFEANGYKFCGYFTNEPDSLLPMVA